ncbi:MAG: 6,7-dimethyl-8-ribityllumazine synthase [Phycisphaerae bacterium]|nr:6,7-dimethyl-8-ribityllumazine synthase [Phycisphaerae bacterium]
MPHKAKQSGTDAGSRGGSGGGAPRVLVAVSRYNASVTDALLEGAVEAYTDRVGRSGELEIVGVPGAFELTAAARAGAVCGRFDGVAALGCIIKGETSHDEYIAHAVAQGLTAITVSTGMPIGLGVLTVNIAAQARARAGGKKGNKGREAMEALLDTIELVRAIEAGEDEGVATSGGRAIPDKARGGGGRAVGRGVKGKR